MPAGSNNVEAAAIAAAYAQRVQILYQTLATNLGDTPGSEQKAVEAFTRGFGIAKRARELALNALGAPAAVTMDVAVKAMDTAKPRTTKRARKPRV